MVGPACLLCFSLGASKLPILVRPTLPRLRFPLGSSIFVSKSGAPDTADSELTVSVLSIDFFRAPTCRVCFAGGAPELERVMTCVWRGADRAPDSNSLSLPDSAAESPEK